MSGDRNRKLKELAAVFLKLGTIGFGGPAAHLAMMEEEVVAKRQWMGREDFLSMVGVTNLIPGPNSTEMAIHIGYLRAGWPGLIVGGVCFILPAVAITGLIAGLYVQYGSLPAVEPFLRGVKPAVVALVAAASVRFGKTAFKSRRLTVIGFGVLAASLSGLNEIAALLAGGLLGALWLLSVKDRQQSPAACLAPMLAAQQSSPRLALPAILIAGSGIAAVAASPGSLALVFLKIGSVLYGSGYVLVAYLQGEFVEHRGWLTQQQLLDAVAVGQFTPGPVLSTATFVGYRILGLPGAAVATAGIFLPSFVFVALLAPILPRLRRWKAMTPFLDAVAASSVALIAAVSVKLVISTVTGWGSVLIGLAALLYTLRWNVSPVWLIVGGAAAGWLML